MKIIKGKPFLLLSVLCVVISGVVNLYGYVNLPKVIATQFSASGSSVNHMPKEWYLIGTFLLVSILAYICISKGQEKKLKFLLVNILIVICNAVLIITQL